MRIVPIFLGVLLLMAITFLTLNILEVVYHIDVFAGSPQCYSTQAMMSRAALDNLYDRLDHHNDTEVEAGTITRADLDREQVQIAALRRWVQTSVHDVCQAEAYNNWLGYYQRQVDEAYRKFSKEAAYRRFKQTLEAPPEPSVTGK